ncbi:hypothetical protein ZOSMA_3G01950 [Zostera marina]|uniref:RNA cytidine acetyltransferase n=1 Tax=Zostera marina TaxID=29655 RepID=A0A0K9P6A3_ZOSMR|nr:hypothetical protein ZOSMA_3G01950 [Zostera marina]
MQVKVDSRVKTLIANGVKMRHRSMFVVVGDKFRHMIINLRYILSTESKNPNPSILWCYKDTLFVSSHKKKRLRQSKKKIITGDLSKEELESFETFVNTSRLTHCKYKDSERVLGNTFGMCVLQDFESLTPNLLARTIETVEGGGLIILALHSLSSLTSLYTMVMDVHERFRTESHSLATGRFNERFLLSLASCKSCVVLDDEFHILPISSHIRSITPVSVLEDEEGQSPTERDLKNLKEALQNEAIVGPLIRKCCTMDQGKALDAFFDAIQRKTQRSIVALTAARGRGKSASLGLAIAGAIAAGFSNISVTAPTPENVKTLFEFVLHGLYELKYKEHLHYTKVTSGDPDLKKAIVQINIFKQHRQTIQYLKPNDHMKLSQVELLVIDEAAAIPLPLVKAMLGPYLVFLSSTVNGYEGTGRSLSLKLFYQLEEQCQLPANNSDGSQNSKFRRVELKESIRYASNDPIESWLNDLLCLDVTTHIPGLARLPPRESCDLYYVNRDTLFSYHKDSEIFLQRMMTLYVSSHYKNSPNDLQLMADAPAHHLFVLLGPVDESKTNVLPDILCVLQVCLEGAISKQSVMQSLSGGYQPFGDQIPWKFSEQFRDDVFPTLSGVRIVRIAVHPNAMRLGYGSRAVELLVSYYEGKMILLNEEDNIEIDETPAKITEITEKLSLLEENITPKAKLPPLLVHLGTRKPEKIRYIGVSFGLTWDLFRFWRKHGFVPFYICQIPNNVTGEHNCMVLKALNDNETEDINDNDCDFVAPFYQDFRQRFVQLLGSYFRDMDYALAMSILAPKLNYETDSDQKDNCTINLVGTETQVDILLPHAMKRLNDYSNNFVDYHTILDIVPILARRYFLGTLPVTLSPVQASVLFCMGLQMKDISHIEKAMNIEKQQINSFFKKIIKKLYKYLNGISVKKIDADHPRLKDIDMAPLTVSLDDELNDGAREAKEKIEQETRALLDPDMQRYAIVDNDADFESALQNGGGKLISGGFLSVKSKKLKIQKPATVEVAHKRSEKANKRKRKPRS